VIQGPSECLDISAAKSELMPDSNGWQSALADGAVYDASADSQQLGTAFDRDPVIIRRHASFRRGIARAVSRWYPACARTSVRGADATDGTNSTATIGSPAGCSAKLVERQRRPRFPVHALRTEVPLERRPVSPFHRWEDARGPQRAAQSR
jgi:hypothetical protein